VTTIDGHLAIWVFGDGVQDHSMGIGACYEFRGISLALGDLGFRVGIEILFHYIN
jgi:hypothetical protein